MMWQQWRSTQQLPLARQNAAKKVGQFKWIARSQCQSRTHSCVIHQPWTRETNTGIFPFHITGWHIWSWRKLLLTLHFQKFHGNLFNELSSTVGPTKVRSWWYYYLRSSCRGSSKHFTTVVTVKQITRRKGLHIKWIARRESRTH